VRKISFNTPFLYIVTMTQTTHTVVIYIYDSYMYIYLQCKLHTRYPYCKGIFSPDREPHPAVAEFKYLQQPVSFSSCPLIINSHERSKDCSQNIILVHVLEKDLSPVRIRLQNRYSFLGLSHLSWSCRVIDTHSTTNAAWDLPVSNPTDDGYILLNLNGLGLATDGDDSHWMTITGKLAEDTPWADKGHVVAQSQFQLCFRPTDKLAGRAATIPKRIEMTSTTKPSAKLDVSSNSRYTTVTLNTEPILVVDSQSGALLSYRRPSGIQIVGESMTSPSRNNRAAAPATLVPNFTRAATDNDRGGIELHLGFVLPSWSMKLLGRLWGIQKMCSYNAQWNAVGLSSDLPPKFVCRSVTVRQETGLVSIRVDGSIVSRSNGNVLFRQLMEYRINERGVLRVTNHTTPQTDNNVPLPRVGIAMILHKSLFVIRYCGRGPWENYPDRNTGSMVSVYSSTAQEMGSSHYIVPGEFGNRTDCRYCSFRNSTGEGVCVAMEESDSAAGNSHWKNTKLNFSAGLHTQEELNRARHTIDLEDRVDGEHAIHVNIDYKMMGVGGDCSWKPCVYPDFLINGNQEFKYSVMLVPFSRGEDTAQILNELRISHDARHCTHN